MESKQNVDTLVNSLQSDDLSTRHDALTTIKQKKFSEADACHLIVPVIKLLDDDVPFVRQVAPDAVISLSTNHAKALGPLVTDHVPELESLLDDDKSTIRAQIATLLGATGFKSPIEELSSRYEYEVDAVTDGIERGFRLGCENNIRSLQENNHGKQNQLVQGLFLLARRHPSIVIEFESDLFSMLQGSNGEIASEVFIELMKTSARTDLSVKTLEKAISVDRDSDEKSIVAAENAIDAVLRGGFNIEPIIDEIDRFGSWLETDDPHTLQRAIRLLFPVAGNSPKYLDEYIEGVADIVVDDDIQSSDEAKKLLFEYAEHRSSSPQSYIRNLLRSTGGQPAFEWLSDHLSVLYYEVDGDFIKPTPGTLGRGLINGLQRAYTNQRTAPVIWPTYTPRVTVTAAITILLECISESQNLVLYTSGSPNHWGGKTVIREEYACYALKVPSSITGTQSDKYLGFDDLLPTDYVYQGTRKSTGHHGGGASLILVSNEDQLDHVDDAGPILFDFHARVSESEEDFVDNVLEVRSNRLVCPIYSLYTKQEHGDNKVPEYGPPTVDPATKIPDTRTLTDTLQSDSSSQDSNSRFPTVVDETFRHLGSSREINVKSVDSSSIRGALDEGYEAVEFLWDNGANHAGWRSFSYLQRFERLSVPADVYDDWIRDKRRKGKQGRNSWMMTEFLEEFGDYKLSTEGIARPGTSDVHEELATIAERLAIENSMFDSVSDTVQELLDDGQSVAVFAAKPSLRMVLKKHLKDQGGIAKHDFRKECIQIVDRDKVRDLTDVDHFVIPGPQDRQYAGFHVHPTPEQITVLSYDGRWRKMISRRVNRWIDQLNEVLQQTDTNLIPEASVSLDQTDSQSLEDSEKTAADEETSEVAASQQKQLEDFSEGTGLQERIAESLGDRDFGKRYTYDRDRYEDYEQQQFAIDTESNETIRLDIGDRILVENIVIEDHTDRRTYSWTSPSELEIGATVLDIERQVWNEIWDDWLDEKYEDIKGGGVTDYLAQWHETLTQILEESTEKLDRFSSDDVPDRIVDRLDKAGIERGTDRIRAWFQSVAEASNPLDLARDPHLTMAPRNAEDIDIIGQEFSKSSLQGEQAELITEARNRIHAAHIREGHKFREHLIEELETESDFGEKILDGSQRYEVSEVRDITDSDDS